MSYHDYFFSLVGDTVISSKFNINNTCFENHFEPKWIKKWDVDNYEKNYLLSQ